MRKSTLLFALASPWLVLAADNLPCNGMGDAAARKACLAQVDRADIDRVERKQAVRRMARELFDRAH